MFYYFSEAVLLSRVWGAAPSPTLCKGQFPPRFACIWAPSNLQGLGFTIAFVLLAAPFPSPFCLNGTYNSSSPEDSCPRRTPLAWPCALLFHPLPTPLYSGTYQGKKRAEDGLHPHNAQNKATMPALEMQECGLSVRRALSCHEVMPPPFPCPPPGGKEEQEGCYKSQRGTCSVDPPSSLGRR